MNVSSKGRLVNHSKLFCDSTPDSYILNTDKRRTVSYVNLTKELLPISIDIPINYSPLITIIDVEAK